MIKRMILIGLIAVTTACASNRPILYPNERLKSVGEQGAQKDIDSCMELAESAGADRTGSNAGSAAANAVGSAAVGAASGAVGGAIVGAAGTGSAIGAASGLTTGLLYWLFRPAPRNPAFENFVNQCLQERGYQAVGWN